MCVGKGHLGGNEMTAMEVTARQSLPDVNINQTIRQHRAVSIPKPYREIKMVAYSFKRRFAEPILAGAKRQTIRADRRRHARPGEELQLYTGMRTKSCRLIARKTCLYVEGVKLSFFNGGEVITDSLGRLTDLDAFARSDGFVDWDEMHDFWRAEHDDPETFTGVLICWT